MKECLDSVFLLDDQEMEIIPTDDGSKDDSKITFDDYVARDKRRYRCGEECRNAGGDG